MTRHREDAPVPANTPRMSKRKRAETVGSVAGEGARVRRASPAGSTQDVPRRDPIPGVSHRQPFRRLRPPAAAHLSQPWSQPVDRQRKQAPSRCLTSVSSDPEGKRRVTCRPARRRATEPRVPGVRRRHHAPFQSLVAGTADGERACLIRCIGCRFRGFFAHASLSHPTAGRPRVVSRRRYPPLDTQRIPPVPGVSRVSPRASDADSTGFSAVSPVAGGLGPHPTVPRLAGGPADR
jgi:hypothetical protein